MSEEYKLPVQMSQEWKSSKLTPQAEKWEEDLPEKYNLQQPTAAKLIRVNEINDIWMEIPRYENITWLGTWVISIGSLIFISLNYFFLSLPDFFFKNDK